MARGEHVLASQQLRNKSTIAKDKLSDEEFDKLVIDTSCRLAEQQHQQFRKEDAAKHSDSSVRLTELGETTCADSTLPADLVARNQESPDVRVPGTPLESSGQPKRPMNAFMVWGQVIRRELHHRFSNVQNASLSKALGRVWRSLDADQKEPYIRRANVIKVNHKRDYPNYRYQPRRIQERRARANMLLNLSNKLAMDQAASQRTINLAACSDIHGGAQALAGSPVPQTVSSNQHSAGYHMMAPAERKPDAAVHELPEQNLDRHFDCSVHPSSNFAQSSYQSPSHMLQLNQMLNLNQPEPVKVSQPPGQHDSRPFCELRLIEYTRQPGHNSTQPLYDPRYVNQQQPQHHQQNTQQHHQHQHQPLPQQHLHHQHNLNRFDPQRFLADNRYEVQSGNPSSSLQTSHPRHQHQQQQQQQQPLQQNLNSCSSSPKSSSSNPSSNATVDTNTAANIELPAMPVSSLPCDGILSLSQHGQQQAYATQPQHLHQIAPDMNPTFSYQDIPTTSVGLGLNLAPHSQVNSLTPVTANLCSVTTSSTYFGQEQQLQPTLLPPMEITVDSDFEQHSWPKGSIQRLDQQFIRPSQSSKVQQQSQEVYDGNYGNYVT